MRLRYRVQMIIKNGKQSKKTISPRKERECILVLAREYAYKQKMSPDDRESSFPGNLFPSPILQTLLSLAIGTILRVTIKSSHFSQKTAFFVSYLSPSFPNPDSILPTSLSSFIPFHSSSPSPIFLPSQARPRCCLLFWCC